MVWYWDEISGESRAVTPVEYDNPLASDDNDQPNMLVGGNLSCSIEDRKLGLETWQMEYVADFPALGMRVVVEQDERAHTCLILTKTEGR